MRVVSPPLARRLDLEPDRPQGGARDAPQRDDGPRPRGARRHRRQARLKFALPEETKTRPFSSRKVMFCPRPSDSDKDYIVYREDR
jgi:hypothetical protein